MTQYDYKLKDHGKDQITASKTIRCFCPSDLLQFGVDDCEPDGNETEEMCLRCWNKEYKLEWCD